MDRSLAPVTDRQKGGRKLPRSVCQTDAISIAILTKPMHIRLSHRSTLSESDDAASTTNNTSPPSATSVSTPTKHRTPNGPNHPNDPTTPRLLSTSASSAAISTPSSVRSAAKSPGMKLLREIQSNLSPQYMRTSTPGPDTPCSRYGRQQKPKESIDCMANDILAAVMRKSLSDSVSPKKKSPRSTVVTAVKASTTPAKPATPLLSAHSMATSTSLTGPGSPNPHLVRTTPVYVSPIEKLIARNRNAVCMARSPHSTPQRLRQHSSDSCSSSGSSKSAGTASSAARPQSLQSGHLSSRKLLNFEPGSVVDEAIAVAATADASAAASPSAAVIVTVAPVAPRVASSGRAPIVVKIAAAVAAAGAAPAVAYQSPRRNKLLPLAPLFSETTTTLPKVEIVVNSGDAPAAMPTSAATDYVAEDFEESIECFRVDITNPVEITPDTTGMSDNDNVQIIAVAPPIEIVDPKDAEVTPPIGQEPPTQIATVEENVDPMDTEIISPFRHAPLKTYLKIDRDPESSKNATSIIATPDQSPKSIQIPSRSSRKLISIQKQLESVYTIPTLTVEPPKITEMTTALPPERDEAADATPIDVVIVAQTSDPIAADLAQATGDDPPSNAEAAMHPPLNKQYDRCPSVDSAKGSSIVTEDDPHGWHEGQIVWARIGNYPFWPSILCNDPNGNLQRVITKQNGVTITQLHVRYFGDNGRRNWIPACNLVAFVSFEDFERMRQELPPNLGLKHPRLRPFTVSAHNRNSWQQALLEAQTLMTVPLAQRLRLFERMLTKGTAKILPTKADRRLSVASQDISFGILFSDIDVQRQRTSTPSLTATPRLLSRSPTPELPESPAYEELSMRIEDVDGADDADHKVHSYLRSISAHTDAAAAAAAAGGAPPPVTSSSSSSSSSTISSSSSSGIQSGADDVLVAAEQDDAFLAFYLHTKESILGDDADDVDQLNDDQLKMLVLKMWHRKIIGPSASPAGSVATVKRKRTSSTGSASSVMTIAANQTISSRPQSVVPVRRSVRDTRPTARITAEEMQQNGQLRASALAEHQKTAQAERQALRAQRVAEKEARDVADMLKYYMREHPKNILFRGLTREPLCRLCLRQEGGTAKRPAVKCATAACNEYVHAACAAQMRAGVAADAIAADVPQSSGKRRKKEVVVHVAGDHEETAMLEEDDDDGGGATPLDAADTAEPAYCPDCWPAQLPVCFVCKATPDGTEMRCTERNCGRHYHEQCLKYWPQSKIVHATNSDRKQVLCPCHMCHICVSDDPRGKHYQIKNSMLVRCVRCPATYHNDSACIPAGSEILTATQLICPRHRVDNRRPVNANWCFICAQGGVLICCETCPTAFHAECLRVALPDRYICEECETGRLPLYGECVWAKMSSCRWWPAVTVPPMDIPTSVLAVKHRPHDFVLRFFGSRDYCWMSRGFVFLYQDGDSDCDDSKVAMARLGVDGGTADDATETVKERQYQKALVEAKTWFDRFRAVNAAHVNPDRERLLKPLPYIKCRNNRPVAPVRLAEPNEENSPQCECRETDADPCGADCWNRALQIECAAGRCRAGVRCQNQRFERRQYPNLAEQRMEGKGWGLVTLDAIAAGDFIIEYVGELINRSEFDRRIVVKQQLKEEHYYFLTLSRELLIDAGPRGNSARFINHSCEPNCETQVWQVQGNQRVGLFALEDIAPNTELTFNYNLESIGELKKTCHCGAKRCAGFIGAKYLEPGEEPNRKKSKTKKEPTDTVPGLPATKKKAGSKSKTKAKKKAAPKATTASTTTATATTTSAASTATMTTTKAALKRKHAPEDLDDNENNRPEQPRASNNKRMKLMDPPVD